MRLSVASPGRGGRGAAGKSKALEKPVRLTLAEAGCGAALERAWTVCWLASALTYLLAAGALLALTLATRPAGEG